MEGKLDRERLSFTSAGTGVEQRSESNDGESHSSPKHPIAQLQGAFEESIYETLQGDHGDWVVDLDAQTRRRDLLENPRYERLCGRKWRQRVDERYHPFWKLTAQMSFGLHLLVQGKAKSSTAVLNILQAHVDEMDGFVSRTTEDFLIIQIDLRTRIQYLSLPLENLDDFDAMLVDRNFRLAMIDYNGKIELAIRRFTAAISDALKDLQKGREAIGGLWQFLGQSAQDSGPLSSSLTAIYNSMLANTEGWNSAFAKLRRKGVALQYAITQLNRAIIEMQRRVGVASRKDVISFIQPPSRPVTRAKSIRSLFSRGTSIYMSRTSITEKPLPSDPITTRRASQRPRTSAGGAGRLANQKSVPNIRATVTLDSYPAKGQVPDRAKSVNGAPTRGSESNSVLPRFSRTISRRLSKAKLTMRVTTEEIPDDTAVRPATSASRAPKSLRKSRYYQQPEPMPVPVQEPPLSTKSKRPGTSNVLTKGEVMKGQLLQYFKSDRVLDAWEGVAEKDKEAGPSTTKEGLWSKFQARSSNMRSGDLSTDLFQDDMQKQMAWLDEETRNLNVYSLKPRPRTAPRFHTLSEHLSFQQQEDSDERHHPISGRSSAPEDDKMLDDDESIITALPAFPLPPIGYRLPDNPRAAS
ncbi:uncharacterized protein BDV14DRAFT_134398 [Aspergillus stella-maris]|uniref:uncharacterized protein n=1 Tax=Aspergillus stella-maris TaxID=1810926 RepID=UPI003CCE2B76